MTPHSEPRTLYFAVQSRFHRASDGSVRTDMGYARYEAWLPYLTGVEHIVVIARISDRVSDLGSPVEGLGVSVMAVPFYQGPKDLARTIFKVHRFLTRELTDPTAIYGARVPNILGAMVQRRAEKLGATFIAQIVGDPEEVLRVGAAGRLGSLAATAARRVVARQVARASAVIYVTRRTLQAKYPASKSAPVLVRSNVELGEESFSASARDYSATPVGPQLHIVAAGSQEQLYKGHQTLIDATALLLARGVEVKSTIIGDGKFHSQLVDQAQLLGIADHIEFVGHLGGAHLVREHIVASDIFAMPSLTEGLPRALIEAMASGALCVGSRAGGIPELLTDDCLFDAGNAQQLADVIGRLIKSPENMSKLAGAQWAEARVISDFYSGGDLLGDFLKGLESK